MTLDVTLDVGIVFTAAINLASLAIIVWSGRHPLVPHTREDPDTDAVPGSSSL